MVCKQPAKRDTVASKSLAMSLRRLRCGNSWGDLEVGDRKTNRDRKKERDAKRDTDRDRRVRQRTETNRDPHDVGQGRVGG